MKIAFFGTGLMGKPMAYQLIKSGYELTIYNRSRLKATIFEQEGCTVAHSPGETVADAELLITMLSDYQAIQETLLDDKSIHFDEKTIIQMGTISSNQSLRLERDFKERGAIYIEAPVLGSIPQVNSKTLIILFGGEKDQYQKWRPLFKHFGDSVFHIGPVGQAMSTKLALNQFIISLTTAFSMSLGFMKNSGVNIDIFMQILRESALYAPTFDKKLPRMRKRSFDNPNFPIKHLLKDLLLIVDEFNSKNIETGPLVKIEEILNRAMEAGYSDQDYSALYNIINPDHSPSAGSQR